MLIKILPREKYVTAYTLGNSTRVNIPLDYVRARGYTGKEYLYAHIKKDNDGNILFCFSEFFVDSSVKRKINKISDAQFVLNLPGIFFIAMNHNPGDKYDVYHDGEGTIIYSRRP